jgi:hypothetical protein
LLPDSFSLIFFDEWRKKEFFFHLFILKKIWGEKIVVGNDETPGGYS